VGLLTGWLFHYCMGNKNRTTSAEQWVIRSMASELSDSSRKELIDWLAADPKNRQDYDQLRDIWSRSGRALNTNPEQVEESWQRFLQSVQKQPQPGRKRRFPFLRIAAALALLAGLTATLVWLIPESNPETVQIADCEPNNSYIITPQGEKVILASDLTEIRYDSLYPSDRGSVNSKAANQNEPAMLELVVPRNRRITLVLSDGSKVWLNSESRLRYPEFFAENTRMVSLVGEAFFDVRKSDGMPFVVKTSEISVEVMGTTFNVTAYADENQISTTLVEGSVRVMEKDAITSCLLKPGERAVFSNDSKTFSVAETDTELYTSWINGYLKFSSESLEQVIHKLVRSYGIEMKIGDLALREYKFSGKLDLKETVSQVLDVVQLAAPLQYHEENGTILILNKNE
jgi:transmembrane sensor